eukprot:gnl/TRDRNA2_/TRDRNA2_36409_c0_seq2.p1 gnl/TRDRNA2_/TRDRNA2_36409_c0~~gnl/TRDRNA2_/TRDRNA2_36409_c0_seq2.p1  ORF type:complete len:363 (+),score=37.01 gnl/TRDRNA2_/TRDRNA2_36409_c0_seq2:101-1189(+)
MDTRREWVLGIMCILSVAVIWSFATVLKQVIFLDLDFNEPLALVYVCNSCYTLHWPLYGVGRSCGIVPGLPWRAPTQELEGQNGVEGSSMLEAVRIGAIIAPVWLAAQWSYSQGVAWTSVTQSTVISTTSCVWTLLLSVMFLGERLTVYKVTGIVACMAGNVATLLGSDLHHGQVGHLRGDLLCVAAAVCYGVYTTILRRLTRPSTSVALIFGSIGAFVFVIGAPLAFWFDSHGFRLMTWRVFALLIFNGIFDNVLSQYAWAKGVQWTSPTTATVGLSLTIPLGIISDLIRRKELTAWTYVAAVLVLVGFVLVTMASRADSVTEAVEKPRLLEPVEEREPACRSALCTPSTGGVEMLAEQDR